MMRSSHRRAQLGVAASVIVLALAVAALLWVPRHSRPITVADVGTIAPDFQLLDLSGQAVTLSDFRGQAVVLYFGSRRDARTAQYDRRVQNLARRYSADARVKFLALDVPGGAAPAAELTPAPAPAPTLSFATPADLARRPFPTLLDERGAVAARYSATPDALPMMVLIDRRGRVAYRGPFDDHADIAFATRSYCAEALRQTLGAPEFGLAKSN